LSTEKPETSASSDPNPTGPEPMPTGSGEAPTGETGSTEGASGGDKEEKMDQTEGKRTRRLFNRKMVLPVSISYQLKVDLK